MSESPNTLAGVVAEHIDAVNAFDEEAIVATFASDALVNDARREFWGRSTASHPTSSTLPTYRLITS